VTAAPLDRSYRALLRVPNLGRVVASMQLARIGQSMVGVAMVLFALAEYDSPALAGLVTFASVVPGLLLAPIAGALLDRHGRIRLMVLDYVVALASLVLIGCLSLADMLPPPLLILIVAVTSVTSILSIVGLRTLFPIMAPPHLWERVNAVDSNGYVVATILGPPLAAILVAVLGAPEAMIAIGLPFGLAALALVGLSEPATATVSSGRLLVDAWEGLRYAWGNPTIRGLGIAVSVLNLAWGMLTIVIPLIVLTVLDYGAVMVGFVFAASGISGMISAFVFGRLDTRGREWRMIVIPTILAAPTVLLMLPATGALGPIAPIAGLTLVAGSMFLFGFLNGPLDIALFTVRQRRTDPAWMGRAFAVSMAINFSGFPIGAAIAGALAAGSLPAAIVLGVVACVASAILAAMLVPVDGGVSVGALPPRAG
jgi:MFS family permease